MSFVLIDDLSHVVASMIRKSERQLKIDDLLSRLFFSPFTLLSNTVLSSLLDVDSFVIDQSCSRSNTSVDKPTLE